MPQEAYVPRGFPLKGSFKRGYGAIEGFDSLGYTGSSLSFGISYGPIVWAVSLFKRLCTLGPYFEGGV